MDVKFHPQLSDQAEPRADRVPSKQQVKLVKYSCPPGGSAPKGGDVLISRYVPGGKEAIRAVLKQRSQSTPLRQEVKVRLLAQEVTPPFKQQPTAVSQRDHVTEEAASLATTNATMVPLIKVQSDLVTGVSQVTEGLRRLRDVGQTGTSSVLECVTQLEEQISATFQQLDLLDQLQSAGLAPVTGLGPRAPSMALPDEKLYGHRKVQSPPDTLTSHFLIPFPTSLDSKARPLSFHTATGLSGRLPEENQNDPRSPRERMVSAGDVDVAMGMVVCQPESSRARRLQLGSPPVSSSFVMQDTTANLLSTSGHVAEEAVNMLKSVETQKLLQPSLLQRSQSPTPTCEDIRRTLREIQHKRKVLDEELAAMQRAQESERYYVQLEAMAGDSDAKEKAMVMKTVDAWIRVARMEMRAENARDNGAVGLSRERDIAAASRSYKGAKGSSWSSTGQAGRKPPVKAAQRRADNVEMRNGQPTKSLLSCPLTMLQPETQADREALDFLMKRYGKALYEGLQEAGKNGSSSAKSKGPRPQAVQREKGVKVNLAKMQTRPFSGTPRSLPLRGSGSQPQALDDSKASQTPLDDVLLPMAIPLGPPRIENRPITMTTNLPPTETARRPNVALLEVTSKKKAAPQLQVQVLPGVDIKSVSGAAPLACPEPPVNIQTASRTAAEEEEANVFPVTHFLAVADITQEPGPEEDLVVQLDGLAKPPEVRDHDPMFPPQGSEQPPGQNPTVSAIEWESLENRLVDWVEQQLMAQMIMEMSPEGDQAEPSSLSKDSCLSASDVAEAAGEEDLQLSVNSDIICHYVNEALAETVAQVLAQRSIEPTDMVWDDRAQEELKLPTPIPTPEASPSHNTLPVATPGASEPESLSDSSKELHQVKAQHMLSTEQVSSLVATPTSTSSPSPPLVATPTSPLSKQCPNPGCQYTNAWGDRDLPLEEEALPVQSDEPQHWTGVLSVAREEEPVSLISCIPPVQGSSPPEQQTPPLQEPSSPPIPTHSTEDSSLSVTETDVEGRHISKGELLLSYSQIAAVRGLADKRLDVPNLNTSLSSTLHGVQDMDYDPPSEGQLIRRPQKHQAYTNRGRLVHQQEACPAEGLWDEESSMGEVSKGHRPNLTTEIGGVLSGMSPLGHATPEQGRLSSPGQVSLPPGMMKHLTAGRSGPISSRNPEALPDAAMDTDSDHQLSEASAHSPDRSPAFSMRQYQEEAGDTERFTFAGQAFQ